jgi:phosphomannomutase
MPPRPFQTLATALTYTPCVLKFGTSGRRGKVIDLTQLEIYINARAELEYLQQLSVEHGGILRGDSVYFAYDLRPSSTRFVPTQGGRGEIAQAIEQAIRDAGMQPVNLGAIPTPALAAYALARSKGSMMVTGSHIPFDRNGYKTYSAVGELLKSDEVPIDSQVERWRRQVYDTPYDQSPFDTNGLFKSGSRPCAAVDNSARIEYLQRYLQFFGEGALHGVRVLVYQHSSVGRDLLVEVLEALGATARPVGRSETFTPIDTEAIDAATLEVIRGLAVEASAGGEQYQAVVSTDGDSDRPLLISLEYDKRGQCVPRFHGGDLLGMLVAEYLQADAIVVPISCNDGIDRGPLKTFLQAKTRIGSPYVIEGMNTAQKHGAQRICGWEANGGFLTGSAFVRQGRALPSLPTRDAFLPILAVLQQTAGKSLTLAKIFDRLPQRYSRAGLLRDCPRHIGDRIVEALNSTQPNPESRVTSHGQTERVAQYFPSDAGFGRLLSTDQTDGARMHFDNGDVVHIRPSGNADELRIYAVADSQERADAIISAALEHPNGVLLRLASDFS